MLTSETGGGAFDEAPILIALGLIGLLGAFVLALVVANGFGRSRSGARIVAQQAPPEGISVMLAAQLVSATSRGMAASLVDLAVHGAVRLVQRPAEGWIEAEVHGVQELDRSALPPDERMVANAVLGAGDDGNPMPTGIQVAGAPIVAATDAGPVRWIQKDDPVLLRAAHEVVQQVEAEALATGLRRRRPRGILPLGVVLALGGLVSFLVLCITQAETDANIAWGVGGLIVGCLLTVISIGVIASIQPFTRRGRLVRDHLEGLRRTILRPDSEEARTAPNRELLLPYAVLFGQERAWAAELAASGSPAWFDGGAEARTPAGFAAAIASFTASAAQALPGTAPRTGDDD